MGWANILDENPRTALALCNDTSYKTSHVLLRKKHSPIKTVLG